MFTFGDQSNLIDKARRAASKGDSLKAIKILQGALRNDESDLPLILEIMHLYHSLDRLNEVIIWAEKGATLSAKAKSKVIGEVEDLFYGRGKPDRLAEYLMEKWVEKADFDGVYDFFRDMSEESKDSFIQREGEVVKNILANKSEFSSRDFTHFYLYAIMKEGRENEETLRIFRIIFEKKPEEIENITKELKRAERENYGDAYLKLGLGEFLLKNKNYSQGVSKLRESVNAKPDLQEEVISILSPYKKKSKEIIDYLSELLIESGKEKKALDLIEDFEVNDAIKKYQKMVKKDPDNSIIHKQLAEAYIRKDRNAEGLKEFLAAVSIESDEEIGKRVKELEGKFARDLDSFLDMASIYGALGWEEEVVHILERAFEQSPSASNVILERINQIFEGKDLSPSALLLKARLLSREGETEAALQIYKELSLDPERTEQVKEELQKFKQENPVSTEGEIISLMLQIPERPEEIAEKVNLIISENKDTIPVMLTEFDKRVKAKPEFAEQFLKFYKNLDRQDFPPFTYPFALAELYRLLKEFDNAESSYKEAINEDPERLRFIITYLQSYRDEPKMRKLIASLYFYKGDFKKGCREVENAAREFPDYVGEITTFLINELKKREDNEAISRVLTRILIQNNYYEEAIKWGSQVLESLELEEQPELMISLAKANSKIGNLSNAGGLTRRAVGLDNSLAETAIELLEEIRAEGNAEYETVMTLYRLYREAGNIDKAVRCLGEALEQKETMGEVMLEECEKLIDIAPIHAGLRIFYGKVKLRLGDLTGIEEIEKGIRFDPRLKSSAVEALEKFENPEVEKSVVFLKASIEKDLGHALQALEYFIEAYWTNGKKRNKINEEIGALIPKVELTKELTGGLLKIYANEERNAPLVGIIDKFFDGSEEKGKYLLSELEQLFQEKIPMPIRLSIANLRYQVEDKQKSRIEMEKLLDDFPEVAEKLKAIIDPDDKEMVALLVRINLSLSNLDEAIRYVKNLDIKEQMSFYEQLLDKYPDNDEIVKEGAYLYFVAGDKEKARFYLGKVKEQEEKEKVLSWFLGKNVKVGLKEIQEMRKRILLDRLEITDDPEERFFLYIKLKDSDEALKEIEKVNDEKKEVLLSDLEAELGNYWEAYQRLSRLKQREDFLEKRVLLAFKSGKTELSLSLLSKTNMNPIKKKVFVATMLREATEKYKRIRPLMRG